MAIPALVAIIAKIMALVEAVLDNWVGISTGGVSTANVCDGIYPIAAVVNDCGIQFTHAIAQAIVAITEMVPQVISGLAANVS
jgi:hypothetical protein